MPLAAVTFDAAGTLFAPAEPVGTTYARVARRHGIAAAPESVQQAFASAFAGAGPLAFPGVVPDRLPAAARAWWAGIVRAALGGRVPTAALDAIVDELLERYARPDAWRVFPDVVPALAALRDRGRRLAVVSNFDDRLPGLLAGLGLAPWFDAVAYSTRAGAAKPAPAIFMTALADLRVPAAEALHVGDSPTADVRGALGAGLRAALLDRDHHRPEVPPGVPVLDSLAALVELRLAPQP